MTSSNREREVQLVREQTAIARVAALIARRASPEEVFAALAREAAWLLGAATARIARYEPDGTATGVASWSCGAERDDGPSLEAPIPLHDGVWGAIEVSFADAAPPADAASRLAAFAGLAPAAIAGAEACAEAAWLAEEHAALRRVAMLVVRGEPPRTLFAAVTEQVGRLLGGDLAGLVRYDGSDRLTVVASWSAEGPSPRVEGEWTLDPHGLAPAILTTGRSARVDDWSEIPGPISAFVREQLGVRSSIGGPIVVDAGVWGALMVHSKGPRPLPAGAESRLTSFAELVATSVSTASARADADRLADEQAALRRVATLVARESPPSEVFAAVTEEVGRLLGVHTTRMYRFEVDGTATVMADAGEPGTRIPVGTRVRMEGYNASALVLRTGFPARLDDHADATGPAGVRGREQGIVSAVGTPITVGGSLWGVMIVASRGPEPLPADTEARIEEFTDLVAAAISNIQARTDLAESRARIAAAADAERRRVVRDLHDGAQQRLVHTVITLKLARRALQREDAEAPALVDEAIEQAERATAEVRELAHGILPAVLTIGGLRAGVEALASRMSLPVEISVSVGRLPRAVEATAYFVVAEALTNVTKHARAHSAAVTARIEDGALRILVRDDGIGGARPDGDGLVGLGDRLAVLGGRLRVESPREGGTLLTATIPIGG